MYFLNTQPFTNHVFTIHTCVALVDKCLRICSSFLDCIFQEVEFSVRVSFLELYNEELFDLLGSTVDPLRLRIYEDNNKKVLCLYDVGKGVVVVTLYYSS